MNVRTVHNLQGPRVGSTAVVDRRLDSDELAGDVVRVVGVRRRRSDFSPARRRGFRLRRAGRDACVVLERLRRVDRLLHPALGQGLLLSILLNR